MKVLRKFVKLSASDFIQMIQDEDICEMYLDALALIDDFLCAFVSNREPPREKDASSIVKEINAIQAATSSHQAIQQNIRENLDIVQDLRAEALKVRASNQGIHW
ncbi:hypothetical protein HYR99_33315, partial [Candidatus Poribacteria bacterium]|nr:hypothetical protein [Candidatus Poribacteria bacterium]